MQKASKSAFFQFIKMFSFSWKLLANSCVAYTKFFFLGVDVFTLKKKYKLIIFKVMYSKSKRQWLGYVFCVLIWYLKNNLFRYLFIYSLIFSSMFLDTYIFSHISLAIKLDVLHLLMIILQDKSYWDYLISNIFCQIGEFSFNC